MAGEGRLGLNSQVCRRGDEGPLRELILWDLVQLQQIYEGLTMQSLHLYHDFHWLPNYVYRETQLIEDLEWSNCLPDRPREKKP